jgi:hypothetical protein
MSSQNQSDLKARSGSLLGAALKHVRTRTLAASLIPVAVITAVPMTVVANEPCGGSGDPPQPPCEVPEPSSMLFVGAGAAATLLLRRRSNRSGS